MADSYGAQSLPISTSVGTAVAITPNPSDPLLTYLASYLKVAINARLGAAWLTLAPGTTAPIAYVFEHDPEQFEFNDKYLPALFLFRTEDGSDRYEQVAQDWRISTEIITALWVLPGATQDKAAARARFPTKFFHLADALIEANRDKAWRVSGDTDTTAATRGSSLATFTLHHSMRMSRGVRRKPLVLAVSGDAKPRATFPAYEALLEVRERLTLDTARNATLDGADGDLSVNGLDIEEVALET